MLMNRLSLDIDDIAMLTILDNRQMNSLLDAFGTQSEQNFVQDTDGRLLPHNSYESDVLDHEDTTAPGKTPVKKEKKEKEKKLTVDVFGTDLTQEARE
jgi:hypothetical protein